MGATLKNSAAKAWEKAAGPLGQVVRSLPYRGKGRYCPVCTRYSRVFKRRGQPRRPDAQCAHCRALERHRLLWLFLHQRTDFFSHPPQRMLHVAPEQALESRFREIVGDGYITADAHPGRADVTMDITDIHYDAGTFDVVYCSHVLEHVLDDRQAMREIRRVLKPDGWAILLVPINAETTFEDPTVVSPEERLRVFGQRDHVRIYGHDYSDRLREAGFTVSVTTPFDLVSQRRVIEMGLTRASGDIFFCTHAS